MGSCKFLLGDLVNFFLKPFYLIRDNYVSNMYSRTRFVKSIESLVREVAVTDISLGEVDTSL